MSIGLCSLAACFLSLATFFAFSHSIARVNGNAAQIMAREKIIVRLIAKFHIERRLFKMAEEGAIWGRLVAPAVITAEAEMPGASLERFRIVVLMVIF